MRILGFEKFSMVDYDGKIACTVFTDRCNFRCPFCHNAALVLNATDDGLIPESEVLQYLELRKKLVDAVCISGGEPTMQKGLTEFAEKAKAMGYLVKLDTNGTAPDKVAELIDSKLIDYVAMDIKNGKSRYAETVGKTAVDLSPIEKSIKLLMTSGIDYEFRTTLVNGYHTARDMDEIAEWLSGAKRYYLQKFVDRGNCLEEDLTEVPKETAEDFAKIVRKSIQKVELRGY